MTPFSIKRVVLNKESTPFEIPCLSRQRIVISPSDDKGKSLKVTSILLLSQTLSLKICETNCVNITTDSTHGLAAQKNSPTSTPPAPPEGVWRPTPPLYEDSGHAGLGVYRKTSCLRKKKSSKWRRRSRGWRVCWRMLTNADVCWRMSCMLTLQTTSLTRPHQPRIIFWSSIWYNSWPFGGIGFKKPVFFFFVIFLYTHTLAWGHIYSSMRTHI